MASKKETKKETKNKNIHEVVIKIDGDAWKEALDKAFNSKKKDAKVDGFRKGKVPKDIYIKKFGIESLFLPAADLVLQDAYAKAILKLYSDKDFYEKQSRKSLEVINGYTIENGAQDIINILNRL